MEPLLAQTVKDIQRIERRRKYRYEYLRSDHWKELRLRKLAEVDAMCESCGHRSVSNDVHHLRYRRLYDVKPKDLVCLCRHCHKELHHIIAAKTKDRFIACADGYLEQLAEQIEKAETAYKNAVLGVLRRHVRQDQAKAECPFKQYDSDENKAARSAMRGKGQFFASVRRASKREGIPIGFFKTIRHQELEGAYLASPDNLRKLLLERYLTFNGNSHSDREVL